MIDLDMIESFDKDVVGSGLIDSDMTDSSLIHGERANVTSSSRFQ
jgi:hypothetical protein